ncbi:MAG: hypothetical protein HQ580_18285 [Planctomycetes bacterium]|nr:hypothetical protein [Planctomycetota bacterium]
MKISSTSQAKIKSMLLVGLLGIVLSGATFAGEKNVKYQPKSGPVLWPSEPPENIPFEQSKELVGILFTGKHSDYRLADTWYPSWASDDNLYSPWTDGKTDGISSSSGGPNATTGQAIMIGDDPLNLKIKALGLSKGNPHPYQGRYPCGSLVYNGIWYYGTYCLGPAGSVEHNGMRWNWPVLGPIPGFRISTDFGKTWIDSPHTPAQPLFPEPAEFMGPVKIGSPKFVDFGKNMQHSPNGKTYLVGYGAQEDDPMPRYANLSWISGDQIYLTRVVPSIENINDESKYEYFAGHSNKGKPIWSYNFEDIKPLLEWNNNMGCVTITYNAPLKKYLMCVTDGWPTVAKMNSYILESDKITGPWKLVTYMKEFGEQGYFLNFPSKFISEDGHTLWLCYSGNFSQGWNNIRFKAKPAGSRYGLVLQEIKLLDSKIYQEYRKKQKEQLPIDPVKSKKNIAGKAKVTASSTFEGYNAKAAVDGVVGGYPENISAEWASDGQKASAKLRLSWDKPYTINRIWLFDRPNTHADQIISGRLAFSDGSNISVGALPDDASAAKEITFSPRKVQWLEFVVSSVKPQTQNIGLAEIAVFTAED